MRTIAAALFIVFIAFFSFHFSEIPLYAKKSDDLRVTRIFHSEGVDGQRVLKATIVNEGSRKSKGVSAVMSGDDEPGREVISTAVPAIEPGDSAQVTFAWNDDAVISPGEQVRVEIEP